MLAEVLTRVAVAVGIALPVAIALCVDRDRLETTRTEWRSRLRISAPIILVLSVVLLINRILRREELVIGSDRLDVLPPYHMTEAIRDLEGEFVLYFQAVATPELTAYFSVIYVYGYAFLLVFPVVAYFVLSDTRVFRRLLTAYALNYALGLVLYGMVIAYGPRNVFVGELGTVLYDHSPEYEHLTREVNRHTNVFPSLHTSLAATVGIFAYYTRTNYPRWFPVAVWLAASVVVSTMYLAIHWAIDVVAGLVLAAVCVSLSFRIVDRWSLSALRDRLSGPGRS